MMTKTEYDSWISKMKMLGELERLRKQEERISSDGLKQFLVFLDEVHKMSCKTENPILDDMSMTDLRIERQQLLARYPMR